MYQETYYEPEDRQILSGYIRQYEYFLGTKMRQFPDDEDKLKNLPPEEIKKKLQDLQQMLEKDRTEKETLQREFTNVRSENEDLKQKFENVQGRVKALENIIEQLKQGSQPNSRPMTQEHVSQALTQAQGPNTVVVYTGNVTQNTVTNITFQANNGRSQGDKKSVPTDKLFQSCKF